jgi:hypothetical protein
MKPQAMILRPESRLVTMVLVSLSLLPLLVDYGYPRHLWLLGAGAVIFACGYLIRTAECAVSFGLVVSCLLTTAGSTYVRGPFLVCLAYRVRVGYLTKEFWIALSFLGIGIFLLTAGSLGRQMHHVALQLLGLACLVCAWIYIMWNSYYELADYVGSLPFVLFVVGRMWLSLSGVQRCAPNA